MEFCCRLPVGLSRPMTRYLGVKFRYKQLRLFSNFIGPSYTFALLWLLSGPDIFNNKVTVACPEQRRS